MDTLSKIRIEPDELKLMLDNSVFIKKQSITEKIIQIYNQLHGQLLHSPTLKSNPHFSEMINKTAKISKGENLKGFPYIIMDYPAQFDKEDNLAYRSMFWWGKSFTFIWHIQGKYLAGLPKANWYNPIHSEIEELWISFDSNKWNYDISKGYIKALDFDWAKIQSGNSENRSLRIVKELNLSNWDQIVKSGLDNFENIAGKLWP